MFFWHHRENLISFMLQFMITLKTTKAHFLCAWWKCSFKWALRVLTCTYTCRYTYLSPYWATKVQATDLPEPSLLVYKMYGINEESDQTLFIQLFKGVYYRHLRLCDKYQNVVCWAIHVYFIALRQMIFFVVSRLLLECFCWWIYTCEWFNRKRIM